MRTKILLTFAILAIVSASFAFIYNETVSQLHCVAEVQSASVDVLPLAAPDPMRCFDTPAEAAEFAMGGAIKPDRSASSGEISQILREYYDSHGR